MERLWGISGTLWGEGGGDHCCWSEGCFFLGGGGYCGLRYSRQGIMSIEGEIERKRELDRVKERDRKRLKERKR